MDVRKISVVLSFLLFLASCVTDGSDIRLPEKDKINNSRFRGVEEAKDIARQIANALETGSRSKYEVKADGITVVKKYSSRSTDCDTIMYAIDFEDNNGFVLIAGPDSFSPILAIVESGSYNDPLNLNNQGYQYILNETKNCIANYIYENRIPITPQPDGYWRIDSINYKYEPSLNLRWNQFWPENIYAPNNVAGCVPVATAMVMAYFEQPSSITYSFLGADLDNEYINWKSIKNHKTSVNSYIVPPERVISDHLQGCFARENSHKTIGRIIRQIGVDCKAMYNMQDTVTSVISENTYNGIKKYLASIDMYESNSSRSLFADLKKYNMALVHSCVTTDLTKGHAWIADGIWRLGMKKYYYEPVGQGSQKPNPGDNDIIGEYVLVKTEGNIEELFHFNWGWGGNSNGWFRIHGDFDPDNSYQFDKLYGNTNQDISFSNSIQYICLGKR